MKKLFLFVALASFTLTASAAPCGGDKDKKACSKEQKACCKKKGDAKACAKADEAKACHDKDAKKADTKKAE